MNTIMKYVYITAMCIASSTCFANDLSLDQLLQDLGTDAITTIQTDFENEVTEKSHDELKTFLNENLSDFEASINNITPVTLQADVNNAQTLLPSISNIVDQKSLADPSGYDFNIEMEKYRIAGMQKTLDKLKTAIEGFQTNLDLHKSQVFGLESIQLK